MCTCVPGTSSGREESDEEEREGRGMYEGSGDASGFGI